MWTHSAFVFESYNAELFQMFKGTQGVPLQICKTFALHRSLPSLANIFAAGGTAEYSSLLNSFISRSQKIEHALNIKGVTILGRPVIRLLTARHNLALHSVSNVVNQQTVVRYFNRIVINGEIVHSSFYCRKLKRNSYVVDLNDSKLFSIETFVVADLNGDGDN